MSDIRFDFNNMFSSAIGKTHGVTDADVRSILPIAGRAALHLKNIISKRDSRIDLALEWAKLPFQDETTINSIQDIGDEIAAKYENVISLGIGGSYLGLKAAQDALRAPYYNEFASLRGGRPRIYFEGNNLDPATLN